MTTYSFPNAFTWGSATSSYQIEGAWQAGGKGESIWDRFTHTPGNIKNNDTGDVANDHYHRWAEDVALMQELNLQAYRFSIAWPRILPDGVGQVNQAGLDFYSRLVDGLLAAGITPYVTLYHWDLPQALQERGGWPARDTAVAFADYAHIVSRHLGDRVKHWITLNEPWVSAFMGYQLGVHAPGVQDMAQALAASHHLMLGHGLAVPRIRQNVPGGEVGITLNLYHVQPASADQADRTAARLDDGYINRWFLDPLYGRQYPADMVDAYAGHLPGGLDCVQDYDYTTIAVTTDFLGINYYTRHVHRSPQAAQRQTVFPASAEARTDIGWEVYPDGLYHVLNRVYFDYQVPKIYITENGASYGEGPDENGRVRDTRRLNYLRDHFIAAHRAIQNGVPLAGYFVWSFMDNFEWAEGYEQRFGIVHVDYETQQRRPKDSALWYKDIIAANAVTLDD